MESLLARCDLEIAEHSTAATLHDRYFTSRPDARRAYTTERLIAARVLNADPAQLQTPAHRHYACDRCQVDHGFPR
jgi:hypothetical protein